MKAIIFKQEKPVTVLILGALLIFLSLFSSGGLLQFLILFSIALLLLGYKISYKINEEYKNKKVLSFFGIPIVILKLKIIFPNYISLFSANFSKSNDWGPVAAMGTKSGATKIVIRLFNESDNFTVYTSSNYDKTSDLALQLSTMLNVELIDNVKK